MKNLIYREMLTLVKEMWRLGLATTENNNGNNGTDDDDDDDGNINAFITDDGRITLSCCLLDESSKKSQKKFKKMVKAHESYWSNLRSEMNILICAFEIRESEELYNKICGLYEQLSKSIKRTLPKENKKTVFDFTRKKKLQASDKTFDGGRVSNAYFLSLHEVLSFMEEHSHKYNDYDRRKMFSFLKDDIESKPERSLSWEVNSLTAIGMTIHHRPNLTIFRGILATIRLWYHHNRSFDDMDNVVDFYEDITKEIIRGKIWLRKQEIHQRRPFFSVEEISSLEDELRIGHCQNNNYKL